MGERAIRRSVTLTYENDRFIRQVRAFVMQDGDMDVSFTDAVNFCITSFQDDHLDGSVAASLVRYLQIREAQRLLEGSDGH